MDELAKLYIRRDGKKYRVKVFQNSVGIERQEPTHGSNRLFERTPLPVLTRQQFTDSEWVAEAAAFCWELDAWDVDRLRLLVDTYEQMERREG
jgi:hypothetical protein